MPINKAGHHESNGRSTHVLDRANAFDMNAVSAALQKVSNAFGMLVATVLLFDVAAIEITVPKSLENKRSQWRM